MLYQILAIAWKDIKVLFKDVGGVVTLFLMPTVFIFILSLALGGQFTSGGSSGKPIDVLVVNQDTGSAGALIVAGLKSFGSFNVETQWEGVPLTRAKAEQLIVTQKRDIAVVVPAGFSETIERAAFGQTSSQALQIDLVVDPALSGQIVAPLKGVLAGLSQQAAARVLAPRGIDFLFEQFGGSGPLPPALREQLKQWAQQGTGAPQSASLVTINLTQPADIQIEKFPNVVQQNVPGFALFGVFFIAQILATSILDEKKLGTLRRILAAPLPRAVFLLGKLSAYLIVNLIQLTLMFAVGMFVVPLVGIPRLELGPHPEALVPISIAASLSATGLGLMLAALGKTSEQIGGLGTLLVLVLAALGGVMVPRFIMPKFMQDLGLISPHAWALTAYQDVLVRGYDTVRVLPEIGALLGFAALFFGVAVWRFRWD